MKSRVLLIEDDLGVAGVVRFALEASDFEVTHTADGRVGLEMAVEDRYDVIVLDWGLPEVDGLSICREARAQHDTPILMLTARQELVDKVTGLESGADDYLSKPFEPMELVARVRALHRRVRRSRESSVLEVGGLTLDLGSRQAFCQGTQLALTTKEFDLLAVMAGRPQQVFSRRQLMDLCWGENWIGDEKTVEVHLRRVRQKLKKVSPHEHLVAVRGVGYRLGG
ncbi:MAG: response regulator transcription factor [Candidatus Eremiobacteraeota bacterium]|nr:response regulator transcription factor [Candidatus Eremiobacteraeota bacterium]